MTESEIKAFCANLEARMLAALRSNVPFTVSDSEMLFGRNARVAVEFGYAPAPAVVANISPIPPETVRDMIERMEGGQIVTLPPPGVAVGPPCAHCGKSVTHAYPMWTANPETATYRPMHDDCWREVLARNCAVPAELLGEPCVVSGGLPMPVPHSVMAEMPAVIGELPSTPPACTCPTSDLMARGCTCGAAKR